MAQGTPQFTPAQILEAGRRAEADGRVEYAVQFYRHLTDHHARSQEALSAREALTRIGTRRPQEATNGAHAPNGVAQPAAGQAAIETTYPPPPSAQADAAARRPAPVAAPTATPGTAIAIAPVGGKRRQPVVLPPPSDGYRLGRIVASVFGFVGWLVAVSGFIGTAIAIAAAIAPAAVAPLSKVAGGWMASPLIGGSGVVGGLLLVFLGQLARAVFDAANATRDLAAMGRARHEQMQG